MTTKVPGIKVNAAYVTLDLCVYDKAENKCFVKPYFVNIAFEEANVTDIDISEVYEAATDAVGNQLKYAEEMKDVGHYSINPKYVAFYYDHSQTKYHVLSISNSIMKVVE